VIAFGGLQDQDISILFGFGIAGFVAGVFAVQLLQVFFAGTTSAP
jgi:uncharacterized membrane protein